MNPEARDALRMLIQNHRQAALAVVQDGLPVTAMVAYAESDGLAGVLIHLSNLSAHKRALIADPRCSLLICEPDPGPAAHDEVMTLARVSLVGRATLIGRETAGYSVARDRYLAKLPTAAMMFALPDFDLFEIRPDNARYIAGFGRAMSVPDWSAFVRE